MYLNKNKNMAEIGCISEKDVLCLIYLASFLENNCIYFSKVLQICIPEKETQLKRCV